MNLKTIAGFRNTEEAKMFTQAIEFRTKGFEQESATAEVKQSQKPVAAH
jgi:hypothetical protein